MPLFPLPPPEIDQRTLGAVHALAAREGKSLAHYAAYGFPDASALDCDPLEARLACCWLAIESDPADGLAILELGHCYRAQARDCAAAEVVYRALELAGRPALRPGAHDEDPLFFLAWLCADADRLEEALALYDRVVERLSPDNEGHAVLHYHVASVYHEAEMWIEAVEEYDLAMAAIRWPSPVVAGAPGRADADHALTDLREPHETDLALAAPLSRVPSAPAGAVVRYEAAFERFFGLESLRAVTDQRGRALRCLPFAGTRGCRISGGSGLYTPPLAS